MRKLVAGVFLMLGLIASPVFALEAYKLDAVHSNVGFNIKHMMVSRVVGSFDTFDGTIAFDKADLANSKISMTIEVKSISTRNDKRDEHLRSPDFFDAAKYPTITFVSKKISEGSIIGDLTMKGVTKEVTIPATIEGPVKTPMNTEAIGINATFTINRQDFGVSYNKTLDQGGLALGNDVNIDVSIEADKVVADKK